MTCISPSKWGRRVIAMVLCSTVCCAIAATGTTTTARADDPGRDWTTTELGITVTQEEILDDFNRGAEFWPAVCRYIEQRGTSMADDPTRAAAVAIIRQTNVALHRQFFDTDEQGALDVIRYTSWSLRRAAISRLAAALVNDRQSVLALRDSWQRTWTEAGDKSPEALADLMARRTQEALAPLALDLGTAEQITQLSRRLAVCMHEMQATETAEILRGAERHANNEQTRDMLRGIVDAADLASISRAGGDHLGIAHFKSAWAELALVREKARTTALNLRPLRRRP